ncbi:MAG: ABC transporter ATP-binding protein [Bacteroidota bacterium]
MLLAAETHHLTRRYGSVQAVRGIDLAVPSGSIYGLLGPNGAGKTTTLRVLLGLVTPTSGTVCLFGDTLDAASRSRLLARVGALIEEPSLYGHLTGRQNLEATRRLRRLPAAAIGRALEIAGLNASQADRRVRTYSQGMRQRLGLGLALLSQPALLILDEPTNGLDPNGYQDLRDVLARLHQEGQTTVIVSSHQLTEVERVATHVGLMRGGQLIRQGPLTHLLQGSTGAVHLRVSAPAQGASALVAAGLGSTVRGDELVLSGAVSDAATATAVRVLVAAGVDVYGVATQAPSLEAVFFAATAEADPHESEPALS